MTEILITGGLGHIGSFVASRLALEERYAITVLDDMSTERYTSLFSMKNIKFLEMDFNDLTCEQLKKFNIVIHLAAKTDAASSTIEKEKTFETNVTKTLRLIDKLDSSIKFIFPSSTSVYGKGQKVMYENEDNVDPQSPYAESKVIVENHLLKSQLNFNILRFGTIFGTSPGMRFHTAINKFCYQASIGKDLTIWRENYEHHRPYLGLEDALSALLLGIEGKLNKNNIYNVLSSNSKLSDIVKLIQEKIDAKITFVDTPLLNQNTYFVNDEKIKKIGFETKDTIETGISKTLSLLSGLK